MLAFTLGSICGLLVLSKALRWFLQHYPEKIIALLIGFILGSLNATWPWKRAVYNPVKGKQIDSHELFWPKLTELENIYVILFILLGFGIVTLLETYGKKSAQQ